jgi:hypothetical protein
MSRFDFQKHQEHKGNYKTVLRFVVYTIVIVILLYLILNQREELSPPENEIFEIDEIEVEF